ncbi:MAG: hypothetical protein RQ885_03670 [Desulfurococcales archaeon]|nr:hypothetical protein [Desulfurococcales archaeon]
MVLVVRGYAKNIHGAVAIEVRETDLWGDIGIPKDTRATGLAISTPYGCVIVIGVDASIAGERVLLASFLDPLDGETIRIIEAASITRKLMVMRNGKIVGSLVLSDEDMGKMEYVATKTRECSQMQNKPVDLDLAAQWFLENFNF